MARVVLGIDAAWTFTNPSGVALAGEVADRWRLLAVAPSYEHFIALAERRPAREDRPRGEAPDPARLLAAAQMLAGRPVDLVAVDMPLSRKPIVGRRASDTRISQLYGARRAATHSPSERRPGKLSDQMRADFEASRYPLRTETGFERGLIEVYPHPALIEFLRAPQRLKYKVAKTRAYWPGLDADLRWTKLREVWEQILGALDERIGGVYAALALPTAARPVSALKAFEDSLDAIVCVAIGAAVLEGRARAHGDADSAIWVPEE